jgi:nucleotide-binding universal stress UspA family protein
MVEEGPDLSGRRGRMFQRILVGYDGSAHARRAGDVAVEIAGRFHSSVMLAIVRPESTEETPEDLQHQLPLGDDSRPFGVVLDELRGRAMAAGATGVDSTVLRGTVVEALIELIKASNYDLVVVGSRGLSAGQRLLLGSVSTALANRAPCPVLVVRPTKRSGGSRPRPETSG